VKALLLAIIGRSPEDYVGEHRFDTSPGNHRDPRDHPRPLDLILYDARQKAAAIKRKLEIDREEYLTRAAAGGW